MAPPAEDRLTVSRTRGRRIAEDAIRTAASYQYLPQLREVLPVVMAGLRPGETVAKGLESYTYLGTAEVLYQRRSGGRINGERILLSQRTMSVDDAMVDALLYLKAAEAIRATWERMAPRWISPIVGAWGR